MLYSIFYHYQDNKDWECLLHANVIKALHDEVKVANNHLFNTVSFEYCIDSQAGGGKSLLGLPDIYTKTNYTLCIDLHMEFYYVWLCCYDNSEYWNCILIMTTITPPRPHHRPQERALLVNSV